MSMVKSETAFVDNQAGLPFLQNRASLWLEIKPRVKWKRNLNSLTNLIIPKILQNKAMLKSFLKTLLTFVKNSEIICFFWSEVTKFFKNASRILIRKTSAISAISLDVTKHDVWKKILDFKNINGLGSSSKPPTISKSSFKRCFSKGLKNTRSASLFFWATVTAYLQSQADIFRGLKADFHVASTCSNLTSLL